MCRSLVVILLFLCHGLAWADAPAKPVQGNQGYIYGTPPQSDAPPAAEQNPSNPHPIAGIIHGIKNIDAWVQQNLW
jgi:hypothetical protein